MFFFFLYGPVLRFLSSPIRCVLIGFSGSSVGELENQRQKCQDYYPLAVVSLLTAALFTVVTIVLDALCYDKEVINKSDWLK